MGLWTVPTKVMLAGEYGVLEPGGEALALATGPGLRVATVQTPGISVLRLEPSPGAAVLEILPDEIQGADLESLPPEHRLPAALWAAARVLEISVDSMVVDLRWEEDLDGWTPVGTSAAASVGLALAITGGDSEVALRLAWTGHALAQGGGSGYDVATCLLGGAVAFTAGKGLLPGAGGFWPCAASTSLNPDLRIVEASTGRKAPTRQLLARLAEARAREPRALDVALADHREASSLLMAALTRGEGLETAMVRTDDTLEALDQLMGGAILTDEVRRLLEIGRRADVPCRISGAGGGDGVVGFARTEWLASRLRMRWLQAGFAARIVEARGGPLGDSLG